jgi:MATE family multidrug resistance protein
VTGAAAASATAQTLGAIWATAVALRRLGRPAGLPVSELRRLLQIGGDLFLRTGFLTFFLLFATRVATQAGAEAGAAHQAIRQSWTFAALGLDALAITAQSLVGYFAGSRRFDQARRVALYSCGWGVVMGALLGAGMWLGRESIAALLVPPAALAVFFLAWPAAAVMQPVNALAFITDGVHWGTGDYAYLRNAVFLATLVGSTGLWLVDPSNSQALLYVWLATAVWIAIRAAFGVLRIWPGIGRAPLKAGA